MHIKITFFPPRITIFLFGALFISQFSNAQCAGEDSEIIICDIPNPANQTINLFNLLQGTPTPGGTWTDIQQSGGLNTTTGILNIWNVNESDTYVFIYTVNDATCADNVATVTVTVGGYAGISNPNASACDDDNSVNLFQFLGNFPNPQLNGIWTDDSGTGALNGHLLDATSSGLGTFNFTYTMPAIGTCPAVTATVNLTVHPAPEAGTASNLILCEYDDFSLYSNLNLLDYISGQEPGGRWTESGTSELSGPFDTFIDVENIFNTFGPGEYGFTYTVQPSHPVCDPASVTVLIIIEEQLDFTGSVLTVDSDICEDEIGIATFTATLVQGAAAIPNGEYSIQYQITGPIGSGNTIVANFLNGIVTFPIPSISFPLVGTYTISIVNIQETDSYGACQHILGNISDTLTVYPLANIDSGTLTITDVCPSSDVPVQLSGNTNLLDGHYELTYNLSGSNVATNQTVTIAVAGGVANFVIPGNLVPNEGATTLTITSVLNLQADCESASSLAQSFVIFPQPNVANAAVAIADICENQPAVAVISGLGNTGSITIDYTLSGANSFNGNATVAVSSGNASFTIPASQLTNTGTTTFTITDIMNSNNCGASNLSIADSFVINANPSAPIATDLEFCSDENATVGDLVPNGPQFAWFDTAASNTPLNTATILNNGDYYVSEVSAAGCISPKTMVLVTISTIPTPTLDPDGQNFCGLDSPAPTLSDLAENVNFTGNLIWYDALSGGNQLPNSQILQDGITYYAFDSSPILGCVSESALAVTVSSGNCDEEEYALMIPDGFSPNGDGINDTFNIPDIEFLFPNFTLEIYNRYGNLMYKGNRNVPDWDGRNNKSAVTNDVAPNGVYFFIVNFNKNGKAPQQGRLYLNR